MPVPELVVISGKGGTGKTSIVASFAALAGNPVLADCDVDACDLHLILTPQEQHRETFMSGHEAIIDQGECVGCGACLAHCRYGAVRMEGKGAGDARFSIEPASCEGCGVCVRFCPMQAIEFPERKCGDWFVSDTRCGPLVYAKLGAGAENSGKLVATVRKVAMERADEAGADLVIVDGPPGIGCPVIASLTGASFVLLVTEPTPSGEHDLERVLALTRHFDLPAAVCVNKWDLNPEMTSRIENLARTQGAEVAGRVRYDRSVTAAQIEARAVVEGVGAVSDDIRALWENLKEIGRRHGVAI